VPAGGFQGAGTGGGQQVQNLQAGLWWPAADPGRLRAAAAAWRRLATDVEEVSAATSAVVRQLSAENHGEGITAFEAYWSSRWMGGSGCLPAVVEAARGLAQALDGYAEAVQKAQDRIKELIAAAATAAIIGIGLTVLTVGISDVAAGAVAASLVATAAAIGVELSAEAAAIIATGLLVASVGALEGGLSDLAIQGERVAYFHDQASIDWQEVMHWAEVGAITAPIGAGVGAGVGAAGRALAPSLTRSAARLGVGELPTWVGPWGQRLAGGAAGAVGGGASSSVGAMVTTGNVSRDDVLMGAVGGFAGGTIAARLGAALAGRYDPVQIAPKISTRLGPRGWTTQSVERLVWRPYKTLNTRDWRWARGGTRMDDPATAYIDKDGHYVIVNDRTRDVVQISDRNDPKWLAPWDDPNWRSSS
jgi:Colicin E5 ribonuclease domain